MLFELHLKGKGGVMQWTQGWVTQGRVQGSPWTQGWSLCVQGYAQAISLRSEYEKQGALLELCWEGCLTDYKHLEGSTWEGGLSIQGRRHSGKGLKQVKNIQICGLGKKKKTKVDKNRPESHWGAELTWLEEMEMSRIAWLTNVIQQGWPCWMWVCVNFNHYSRCYSRAVSVMCQNHTLEQILTIVLIKMVFQGWH